MSEEDEEEPEKLGVGYPFEEWEAYGLKCRMAPGFSSLNGYVQIPPGLFNPKAVERVLSASGGITYGADDEGWVGFDTAHAGDYWAPDDLIGRLSEVGVQVANEMRDAFKSFPRRRRWTVELLKQETEQLAQQVAVALDIATISVENGDG